MKVLKITAGFMLLGGMVFSQTAAPKIPLQLLKDFYAADAAQQRSQRELDTAQHDYQSAQASWKQAVDAMQKACGDKYQLRQDSVNADPYCAPKQEKKP